MPPGYACGMREELDQAWDELAIHAASVARAQGLLRPEEALGRLGHGAALQALQRLQAEPAAAAHDPVVRDFFDAAGSRAPEGGRSMVALRADPDGGLRRNDSKRSRRGGRR